MTRDLATGGWRKPPCVIEDFQLSYTGKYWGFLGTHFHEGRKCWQVGSVNTETGETIARHYNERNHANETLAKHEAQEYWEELKAGLARKPTEEELQQDKQLLEAWEESAKISQRLGSARSRPN